MLLKAALPIVVTLLGIVILVSLLLQKADPPIVVTLLEIVILVSSFLEKTDLFICVILVGIVILVSLFCLKAASPILVTLFGMLTLVSLLLQKADPPMVVRLTGMLILVSLLPKKAEIPKVVRLFGMLILVSSETNQWFPYSNSFKNAWVSKEKNNKTLYYDKEGNLLSNDNNKTLKPFINKNPNENPLEAIERHNKAVEYYEEEEGEYVGNYFSDFYRVTNTEMLETVEKDLGIAIPKQLKEMYLTLGNGTKEDMEENTVQLFGAEEIYPITQFFKMFFGEYHEYKGDLDDIEFMNTGFHNLTAADKEKVTHISKNYFCLLYTSPSPRD